MRDNSVEDGPGSLVEGPVVASCAGTGSGSAGQVEPGEGLEVITAPDIDWKLPGEGEASYASRPRHLADRAHRR